MPSLEEQLKVEEGKLRKLAKWRPRGNVATIQARTAELTATGENVRRLRAQLAPQVTASALMAQVAARRQYEAEQRAKAVERKQREPARKAAKRLLAFAHPELAGANLNVERLSVDEGVELLALVEERRAGELSGRKLKKYERLVGTLAGEPELFARHRREREQVEREAAEAERARLESMATRTYSGKGACYLPAYVFEWLRKPTADSMSVVELGVLAALLFSFEYGEAPFHRSTFSEGMITLDAGAGYQLRSHLAGELSAGRTWEAVRYLADNGWIELERGTRTSIMLGERGRRLRDSGTAHKVVTVTP